MNLLPNATDYERVIFLQKLLGSDVLLDEWETRFTASFRLSARPSLWFTEGRRGSTDNLWRKYGALINHPTPADTVQPPALATAVADGCEYFVRDDETRQQVRCNEPAALVSRTGFRYCQMHADIAQKSAKRSGGKLELKTYCAR